MTGTAMKKLLVVTFVALGFAVPASAAPIVGTLNLAGQVTVTATTINWLNSGSVEDAVLVIGGDGYFDELHDGIPYLSYAQAIDLSAPPPVDGFLHDFVDGDGLPVSQYDGLEFDLETIVIPSAPLCNGSEGVNDACRLGVFTLTLTDGGNVDVRMDVIGTWQQPGMDDTPATGIYTAESAATSIQQIINTIAGGGSMTNAYSATITSVPEPATLLTFGAGSLLLAAHRRRRAAKGKA
jgi:hypothetical protein